MKDFRTIETDVLVVGAGGAGGSAALEAGRNNVKVILVEKGFVGKSGTTTQAGVRALSPRQWTGPGRENVPTEERFKFFLEREYFLADQDILWACVDEAKEGTDEIKKFAQEMKAGPQENWCNALRYEISKYLNISIIENTIITKLLTIGGRVVGATALDIRNGNFLLFRTKAVILATGGYCDLYRPSECTPLNINGGVWGDGQALAYHAGAELCEMEMTNQQTLPDTPKWNQWWRHGSAFDSLGPFCDKDGNVIPSLSTGAIDSHYLGYAAPMPHSHYYRPQLEMTVYQENMKRQVYYNAPAKIHELIEKGENGNEAEKALKVDLKQVPLVKVVIGPLIGGGGPKINVKAETNIQGLYAAGECPGNIYGAYRANPFADGILPNGKRAGKYAAEYAKTLRENPIDIDEVEKENERINGFLKIKPDSVSPVEFKKNIWALTRKYLFMIRNAKGLTEALEEIDSIRKKDLPRLQAVDVRRMNIDLKEAIEAVFALDVAEMIARSALFREESRGAQYRDDFPEMDNDKWLCHTLLWKDSNTGEMRLSKGPIVMNRFKPPVHIGEEPIRVKEE